MLDEIMPSIYQRLREMAGLTKKDLAPLIEVNRHTVRKFENGKSRPSAEQAQKLLELAQCTQEQVVEMVCEKLSERIGRPIGFLSDKRGYVPTTALAKAEMIAKRFAHQLSARLLSALHIKIKTMQFMGLAAEGHNAEMQELVELCMEKLQSGEE